ncbi:ATP-binding protein [Pokkaliibacter sp. CJK22405]|uniref:ATP-binding protein n=1 Tax=Pokkaliibacter sp. CJK22405 TaxID=3384615 RepID=UPI0039849AB2
MSHANSPTFFSRVWRSYLKSALIPIILIELALVVAYLLTNSIIRDENIQSMRNVSRTQLDAVSTIEADRIADQLEGVANMTRLLQKRATEAYMTPFAGSEREQSRYNVADGVLYTTNSKPNEAAFFMSNLTPAGAQQRERAIQLSQLDPLFRNIVESQPLVAQVYINTQESMNRIYPAFDVFEQFPHDMNIPEYNFFYEADGAHNPSGDTVWTDVYQDPAGQGWMTSSIAPVYLNDQRQSGHPEAVVGLDVTLDRMITQVKTLHVPWDGYGVLIDRSGNILAIPPQGEADWSLPSIANNNGEELPDAYNLNKRSDTQILMRHMQEGATSGMTTLTMQKEPMLISWHQINGTNWYLMAMTKEKNIFADAIALNSRFNRIGFMMIAALVAFYVVFFIFLYRKAGSLARSVADPLRDVSGMIRNIGQGNYYQRLPHFNLQELDDTARGVVLTGQQLGQYTQALEEAKTNLETLNRELEARVMTRTEELQELNGQLSAENKANARLINELQQTQAQLIQSEKMASIGQLAAGVAHEINNPMAYISANIEAMGDYVHDLVALNEAYEQALPEEPTPEKTSLDNFKEQLDYDFLISDLQALITESREGTRRVKKIIEDLREFSHTADDKWARTDLHKGLESTLNIANNELKYKATVEKEYGDMPEVECIPSQINQVILNLLVNAAQAIENSGTVTVRTGTQGDQAFIAISDTGCGIAPNNLNQIFNPFFTTKPVGKGTGLGLAMSYNIMEKHHGRIEVQSKVGEGTTFTLWLPIRQTPPEH